jgi:hypothetical protein
MLAKGASCPHGRVGTIYNICFLAKRFTPIQAGRDSAKYDRLAKRFTPIQAGRDSAKYDRLAKRFTPIQAGRDSA